MKTLFKSVFFLIAFYPFTSFGQLHIRPEVGVNLAHLRIQNIQSSSFNPVKNITSLRIGAFICYYNTPKTFLEAGVFYSGKGYKEENVEYYFPDYSTGAFKPRDTASFLFKANYLEVPLNFGYEISLAKYGKLSPMLGLYAAYLLGGKKKFKSSKDEESFDLQVGKDSYNDIRAGDFGVNASLMYKSPIGLYFRAQYSFGVAVVASYPNQRNRVLSFSIGYDWKVKKK